MLSFLRGKMVEATPQFLILQAGGLGIKVQIPTSLYFNLPAAGTEITVHTVLQLKDDELFLYGFSDAAERDFFRLLNSVTGIGPKVSLALLGHLTIPRLVEALLEEDMQSLSTVPGIGSKTARRLIYELKDKISPFSKEEIFPAATAEAGPWTTVQEALLGLGYSPAEVARARKLLGNERGSVEDIFKKALNIFAQE